MPRLDGWWTSITYALSFLTLSPFRGPAGEEQSSLLLSSAPIPPEYPIFPPPGGKPGSTFMCRYPEMGGFKFCSTPENRGCWLRNDSGFEFNIYTNYEDPALTPVGITRHYYLNLTDEWLNADGENFTEAKLFDKMYPGPWIQACWGDVVSVTVYNKLKSNGTSIHWHGIRQLKSVPMDGVNGVTQCPIAPGGSFEYTWRARQYGSSWYHSHYSVQYADGAAGPLTLHGPSSANYDEAIYPLLMTDWGHNSAFAAIFAGLQHPSILLDGRGNVTQYNNNVPSTLPVPEKYTIHFDPKICTANEGCRRKRYLLRLINTSFESTFIFSIDNHMLQIVGADFVPIYPYQNTSVLVGIGQRYHVIVESNDTLATGNYWIRTWRADCFHFPNGSAGYEKTGILRYHESTALPTTEQWGGISFRCSDETYTSLKPIVPWKVGPPANDPSGEVGQNLTVQFQPNQNTIFPLAKFSMGGDDFNPLRINYGNPTILNLNYTGKWDPLWVVFPEDYTENDWVYMVLKGLEGDGAHPIHLHGHDFAILQQIENAVFPDRLNLNTDNPPRRDVVLLPDGGYVVIAFKTDNPGTWLIHCHIAFHASFGLALQILERQQSAASLWPSLTETPDLVRAQEVCNDWNNWWGNCNNWWPGNGKSCPLGDKGFSPDSGI